ncbi:aldehyde dehydrogenase family protein, partial [Candidatus Sumerlaeota bacterium]|nr:aldehyde dehydrogenase family protein [Candidatus Sumerlaeota bacterium]
MAKPRVWKCFVDGKWASSQRRHELRSPYDNHLVATVCQATPAQMERAIAGADRAFKPFSELPAYERAGMLMRVAEGLR